MKQEGKYKLTLLAEYDIDDIYDYTIDRWDEKQAEKYIHELYNRFEWLSEYPKLGTVRDDLMRRVLTYPQGEHTILYRVTGEKIEIGRVFGPYMDIEKRFPVENPFIANK